MTAQEASELQKWDRVCWDGDSTDQGIVTEVSTTAFHVKWENGQEGWIHFEDAQRMTEA